MPADPAQFEEGPITRLLKGGIASALSTDAEQTYTKVLR